MPVPSLLRRLTRVPDLNLRSTGKWLLLSSLVGAVAGLGATLFHFLCQAIAYGVLGRVAGFFPGEAAGEHLWFSRTDARFSIALVGVIMTCGGFITGFIVYRFAPEAEGHGTDAAIDAYHRKRGFIRPVVPLVKMLSSAVTIGTGGSAGREGPIAQIGAGFGSALATYLKLPARDRRILLAAGMGAGVGAIFRAPLAGALFAAEILYREAEFESEVIIPAAMSSTIAYSIFSLMLPESICFTPLFGEGLQFRLGSFLELIPLAFLAMVLALFGFVFTRTFYGTHRLFQKLPFTRYLRPALGAALAALFAVGVYALHGENRQILAILSTGYGALQVAMGPEKAIGAGVLFSIALGKIITTSLTIGSGGSGGVFGPSMVIGGCAGGAVGQCFHALCPGLVPNPQPYVILGMAGFFAGCAHAPFSTIVMVSEMTGDYRLLLPTIWVSTLCFLFCKRCSLYEKQVASRVDSPAHRGDFFVDILEGLKVRDAFEPGKPMMTVPDSMALERIVHLLAETRQVYFPVVDSGGKFVGIFSSHDVRPFLYDETIWRVAIAKDIMVTEVLSVCPEDDLNTALRRFTERNLDEIPVLDALVNGHLVGMLRRKDVITLYNKSLMEHKMEVRHDASPP